MVISCQMQKAMDQKSFQFFIHTNAVLFGLSLRFLKTDDDIAEGQAAG